jgi:hypothetical protein
MGNESSPRHATPALLVAQDTEFRGEFLPGIYNG